MILPKSLWILSKLSVDQPPSRISIVRGNPSKVFADPFQVECQMTPPDQYCQRCNPSKVFMQILSKLSVKSTPPPRISIVRGDPSKVFADPFQVECRLTPPGSALSEVILPKSLQILSKLSVDQTPPGSALSEAFLPKSLWILSKLSVN